MAFAGMRQDLRLEGEGDQRAAPSFESDAKAQAVNLPRRRSPERIWLSRHNKAALLNART
jgi:hypothetical protein